MRIRFHVGLTVVLVGCLAVVAVRTVATGVELLPQAGHTAGVTAVAFRPGATQVLTASSDGTAILWDARSGRKLRTYKGGPLSNAFLVASELQEAGMSPLYPLADKETPSVASVEFSDDGRWFVMLCLPEGFLASLRANSQAVLFDTESGKRIRAFDLDDTSAIALSRDGKQLLCGGSPIDPAEAKEMTEMGVKIKPTTGMVLRDIATGNEIRQFGEYDTAYEAVQFSPDGKYVLGCGRDLVASSVTPNEVNAPAPSAPPAKPSIKSPAPPTPAPPIASGRETKPAQGPAPKPRTAGILRLWDAAAGKEILSLRPQDAIAKAAFSPSGEQILTVSSAETLEVWDVKTKKCLLNARANAGTFSTDGKQIVTTEADGTIGVWDLAGGKKIRSIGTCFNGIKDIARSREGSHLLVGMSPSSTPRPAAAAASKAPAASPAKPLCASGEAALVDISAGLVLQSYSLRTDPLNFVSVSPTGQHLLIGDSIWDTQSGQKLGNLCSGPLEAFSAAFSPDGKHVVVANHHGSGFMSGFLSGLFGPPASDTLATLLDVFDGTELVKFEAKYPVENCVTLSFTADGKRVCSAIRRGALGVWDAANGKKLSESRIACSDMAAAFSPDGRLAVVAFTEDKTVWWNRENGEIVLDRGRQKGPPTRPGTPPVSNRDGKIQLTLAEDGQGVVVQDTANAAASRTLKGGLTPTEGTRAAGFDLADDRFVFAEVSSPYDGLWDMDAGKRLRAFPLDESFSTEVVAFVPDGKRVVTAGDDGYLIVWDIAGNKKTWSAKLGSPIMAVAVSSDGTRLAAGCANCTVAVVRLVSGKKTVFQGHKGPVTAVAFRPDGKLLVTASHDDGTTRIWDVAAGKELAQIISVQDRHDWLIFTPDGAYDGSRNGLELVAFRNGEGLDVQTPANHSGGTYRPRPALLSTIWGGQ